MGGKFTYHEGSYSTAHGVIGMFATLKHNGLPVREFRKQLAGDDLREIGEDTERGERSAPPQTGS